MATIVDILISNDHYLVTRSDGTLWFKENAVTEIKLDQKELVSKFVAGNLVSVLTSNGSLYVSRLAEDIDAVPGIPDVLCYGITDEQLMDYILKNNNWIGNQLLTSKFELLTDKVTSLVANKDSLLFVTNGNMCYFTICAHPIMLPLITKQNFMLKQNPNRNLFYYQCADELTLAFMNNFYITTDKSINCVYYLQQIGIGTMSFKGDFGESKFCFCPDTATLLVVNDGESLVHTRSLQTLVKLTSKAQIVVYPPSSCVPISIYNGESWSLVDGRLQKISDRSDIVDTVTDDRVRYCLVKGGPIFDIDEKNPNTLYFNPCGMTYAMSRLGIAFYDNDKLQLITTADVEGAVKASEKNNFKSWVFDQQIGKVNRLEMTSDSILVKTDDRYWFWTEDLGLNEIK